MPKSLEWRPPRDLYSGDPKCINSPIYFNQFQTIKKEEWRKYPFREEMGEDLDYVMHHLLMSKFKKIPKYLYGYRQNKNSFSRAMQIDLFTKRYQNGYYYLLLKKNDNKYAKNNLI